MAGANISEKRWSSQYKAEIAGSRILSLKFIREFLQKEQIRLKHFTGASAIGYYGCTTDQEIRTETSAPGNDFLASVVVAWEKESQRMQEVSEKIGIIRTGVVFDKQAGAFPKIIRPLKAGIPLILGSGKQFVNWISLTDIVRVYRFVLEQNKEGVFNAVAPGPPTYGELIEILSEYLRPAFFRVKLPAFILKWMFGEMSCLVLEGIPVSSARLKEEGFEFLHDNLFKFYKDFA